MGNRGSKDKVNRCLYTKKQNLIRTFFKFEGRKEEVTSEITYTVGQKD